MPDSPARKRRVNQKRTVKQKSAENKKDTSSAQEPKSSDALSRGFVVFLTTCCILTTLVCVQYLQERSHLISLNDEIGILESRYNTIKGNNDARYNQIISSFTLEDVKDAAENRLGMHYAGADQVRYYSLSQDSYVRQYKEVTRTEQGAP